MARPRRDPDTKSEPEIRTLSALNSVVKMAKNPDAPMPIAITASKAGEAASVTKLYEDGGARMRFARELMARAFQYRGRRWTAEEAQQLCIDYFSDCEYCQMPATIGGLALYMGMTQKDLDNRIRASTDEGSVLAQAKESIRIAMEMAASDGTIAPLVYFHQQGAYHGYAQKTEVSLTTPLRLDPDETEVDQIIAALPDAQ